MDAMRNALDGGLSRLELPLSEETRQKLCGFGAMMVAQNEVMNLTAITEPERVGLLHLTDSLTVMKCADLRGKTLIDVGCGAGFPGIPLAIACPDARVTLLDSLAKRTNWLETVLPRLELHNARCVTARAEEYVAGCRETFDYATSRAVARLNSLLEITAPYVKVGGAVLAMKGSAAREELEEARSAMEKLGLKTEKILDFPMEDAVHSVIVLRKVKPTPARYPRRYAKIKQNPL